MSTKATPSKAPGSTDRIETRVEVRAPRARVWRAISTASEFSAWFRISIEGVFAPGTTVTGTSVKAGREDLKLDFQVEQIRPEDYFSYRWHPYALDPAIDYSTEPTTLVEFQLEDIPGGTAVTITESGFDRIPLARRAEAFRMNQAGWTSQSQKLAAYVA